MSANVSEAIISDFKRKLGEGQIVVEAKLRTDDSAAIAKVLSIQADARILNFEALNGEATYNGRVALKVLYVSDTGECGCFDYNADFSDKLIEPAIQPAMNLSMKAAVIDTNASAIGSDSIKVSCVLDITAYAIVREQVESADGGAPDIYTRTESVDYCTLASSGKQEFVVTQEMSTPEEIEKILMSEAEIHITDMKPVLDSVLLSGKIYTNVVYMPKNAMLTNRIFETDFSQEVACLGANADSVVDYCAAIEKWHVTANTFEGENKSVLRLEFRISVTLDAYQKQQKDVTVDAFCIGHEILIDAESRNVGRMLENRNLDCKIEGSADLQDGMPTVDRIMAICGSKVNIANCYSDTDRLVVEGVMSTSVVYFNKEFENYNSVAVEIPYSVSVPFDGLQADNSVVVRPCLTDISARGSQRSVEVSAKLALQAVRSAETNVYCIKDIKKGDARELDLNAIAIYIAKPNQTLWDVAKALSTTPELLLTQNPNLTSPLQGGEKVIIYRQL